MMKLGILTLFYFLHVAQCVDYIVKEDPFKTAQGYKCDFTRANEHFLADPHNCDRFMACIKGRTAVMYCPKGRVFDTKNARCSSIDLPQSTTDCQNRGAFTLETPGKPDVPCYSTPQHSEPAFFKLQKDGSYFKMASLQHVYYFCKKGFNKAHVVECTDPKNPEVLMDSNSPIKCSPKGSLRQHMVKKTQGNLASQKHAGFKPKNAVMYKKSLPIRFQHDRPRCPKHPQVKAHFGFTDASRFMHNSDCIHFWTCSTDNTPRLHSCPRAQVFDPETERCIYYKHADSLCNKVFDYESPEKLALYQRLYGLEQQVEERQTLLSAQRQAEIMRAQMGQIKAEEDLLHTLQPGTPEFKSAAMKLIASRNRLKVLTSLESAEEGHSRKRRSFNLYLTKTPDHLGRIIHDQEYEYHEFQNVTVDANGVLRCPPAQLIEGVKQEDVMAALNTPHFNAHNFYDMDSFRFGVATLYPITDDCDNYYICGPWEHASQDNRPSIGGCSPGQAFQPLRIKQYNSLVQYAFVPNTGRCLDADKVAVKGCKRDKPSAALEEEPQQEDKQEDLSEPLSMLGGEEGNGISEVQEYMSRLIAEIEEDEKMREAEEMAFDEPFNYYDEFVASKDEQDLNSEDFSGFLANMKDLSEDPTGLEKDDSQTFGSGDMEI